MGAHEQHGGEESVLAALPGIEAHAHARAVLGPALPPVGSPSHAYLFHGPAGTGKRATARAFAAALLADGAADPAAVAARVERGAHPDLVWVAPSGATEMLVADIEEPVVAAATRTPFESRRRVFVIEAAETMNDQAANRMLKTLEEPPSYAHLLLLTDRRADVLATIASRCQQVRFDPLPAARVAEALTAEGLAGVSEATALACARLAQGDAALARLLAGEAGTALRSAAEEFVRAALAASTHTRPWLGLLEAARAAGQLAGEQLGERVAQEAELLPSKERKRYEREAGESRRRGERRARLRTLDTGLQLAELWLRDVLCVREGAPEVVLACDRTAQLEQDARGRDGDALLRAVALVSDTRLSLALNVSEELALEALAYRLQAVLTA
jgi:DNA polymerase-3 subunit delta'